jgi:hypothetical protein
MKKTFMINVLMGCLLLLSACGGGSDSSDSPSVVSSVTVSPTEISVDYDAASRSIAVTAPGEWTAYSNESWITCSPSGSVQTTGTLTVSIAANSTRQARTGSVTVKSGTSRATIAVSQQAKPAEEVDASIQVPDGYELVWHDEFNEGSEPNTADWYYETGAGGWGNNELQNYVKASTGGTQLAKVSDGTLKIICQKINGTVYSIRMNTNESWKYGYFEARLKLPTGKGTWPAFWMMPKNYTTWPGDGEIDIMEEVGYNPNYVSSTIHCNAYNGGNGTQKTTEKLVSGAQTEFHVYAMEWTETYIRSFIDGVEFFRYTNDGKGSDYWPFNAPFYIKLNLAWGGNWGGAQGVDESVLPATYEVDYVRVFQKK